MLARWLAAQRRLSPMVLQSEHAAQLSDGPTQPRPFEDREQILPGNRRIDQTGLLIADSLDHALCLRTEQSRDEYVGVASRDPMRAES